MVFQFSQCGGNNFSKHFNFQKFKLIGSALPYDIMVQVQGTFYWRVMMFKCGSSFFCFLNPYHITLSAGRLHSRPRPNRALPQPPGLRNNAAEGNLQGGLTKLLFRENQHQFQDTPLFFGSLGTAPTRSGIRPIFRYAILYTFFEFTLCGISNSFL